MKRLALMLAVLSGLSCGGGAANVCCTPTVVSRNFGYAGTYSADGGVATEVQLIISSTGAATLSFVRGGERVEQTLTVGF